MLPNFSEGLFVIEAKTIAEIFLLYLQVLKYYWLNKTKV